jgi:phage protein D
MLHLVLYCLAVCAQERLWKRRAAYHIGQAAAAEGRRRLAAAAAAAEAAAKEKASKAKQEEEQQKQKQKAESIAGVQSSTLVGVCNRGRCVKASVHMSMSTCTRGCVYSLL